MPEAEGKKKTSESPPARFSDDSLGYQVNLLARIMERALAARIQQHGVVPGQFAQLLALYEVDGQSITELAAAVAIEHPTMSRTVSRMERDGLVVVRPDGEDGRSRRIHLTDHARSLEATLKAEATAVNEAFLSLLSGGQEAQLLDLLKLVASSSDTSD